MAMRGLDRQFDIEQLVAWMDGELPASEAQVVAERVQADPDWQATYADFRAVDAALEMLATPAASEGLTERIVRAAHRREMSGRVVRILAPLAAAAAIVVAVWLGSYLGRTAPPTGVEGLIAKTLRDVPKQDRFLVQNLPLFQNYREILSYEQVRSVVDGETLSALAALEAEREM